MPNDTQWGNLSYRSAIKGTRDEISGCTNYNNFKLQKFIYAGKIHTVENYHVHVINLLKIGLQTHEYACFTNCKTKTTFCAQNISAQWLVDLQ